eukprot:Amastigsp_a841962_469.p2 type:complete len:150 gc:universal Amastigsp_a841962_469:1346-897(-)
MLRSRARPPTEKRSRTVSSRTTRQRLKTMALTTSNGASAKAKRFSLSVLFMCSSSLSLWQCAFAATSLEADVLSLASSAQAPRPVPPLRAPTAPGFCGLRLRLLVCLLHWRSHRRLLLGTARRLSSLGSRALRICSLPLAAKSRLTLTR